MPDSEYFRTAPPPTFRPLLLGNRYVFAKSLDDAARGRFIGTYRGQVEAGAVFFIFDDVCDIVPGLKGPQIRPRLAQTVWVNAREIGFLYPYQEQKESAHE